MFGESTGPVENVRAMVIWVAIEVLEVTTKLDVRGNGV
jgi:hypothetical protein